MKFISLNEKTVDDAVLEKEYKGARQIGAIRLGETCFIFKSKMKNYYIPYADIKQCFRRVMGVNLKMCCGKGEMQVEAAAFAANVKRLAAKPKLFGKPALQGIGGDLLGDQNSSPASRRGIS